MSTYLLRVGRWYIELEHRVWTAMHASVDTHWLLCHAQPMRLPAQLEPCDVVFDNAGVPDTVFVVWL